MSLAAAVQRIAAAGVRFEAQDGALAVQSRQPLTEEQRDWIRTHRQELLDLLTRPRWVWLVHHHDGRPASHSFTPEATLAQVRAWYPGALSITPEDEPPEDQEVAP